MMHSSKIRIFQYFGLESMKLKKRGRSFDTNVLALANQKI